MKMTANCLATARSAGAGREDRPTEANSLEARQRRATDSTSRAPGPVPKRRAGGGALLLEMGGEIR
jgi:hypothetical protein